MHVGIIVDHPKRDLPGAAMLASSLIEKKSAVSLIPLYEQGSDVPLLGLDALVVNFARPTNIDLVQGYAEMGLPIYVLDTEGGVLAESGANSPDALSRYVNSSGYSELLAGYFFWGPELHRSFELNSALPAAVLRVTGCPRFDYASPKWRDLLRFHRSDYVLVNANFPLVNPRFVRSADLELRSLMNAGWDQSYVETLVKDTTTIFDSYVDSIATVAKTLPGIDFILRPHPFENPETYQNAFRLVKNVSIDGRGSVLNMIRRARCVLHLNCGTAVESVMLGRLPISLEYLNTPFTARHGTLPSRVSIRANSVDEVRDAIAQADLRASAFPFDDLYQREIYPWFFRNDGNASDRIATAIIEDQSGKSPTPVSLRWALASSRRRSRPFQKLQAIASMALGSNITSKVRAGIDSARRGKIFTQTSVGRYMNEIAHHERRIAPKCQYARHPSTGFPLATVTCRLP